MALKPKDVGVPLPVQLILDCHWLVCVRWEGLTDRSIVAVNGGIISEIANVPFHEIKELYLISNQLDTVPGKQLGTSTFFRKLVFTRDGKIPQFTRCIGKKS